MLGSHDKCSSMKRVCGVQGSGFRLHEAGIERFWVLGLGSETLIQP